MATSPEDPTQITPRSLRSPARAPPTLEPSEHCTQIPRSPLRLGMVLHQRQHRQASPCRGHSLLNLHRIAERPGALCQPESLCARSELAGKQVLAGCQGVGVGVSDNPAVRPAADVA